MGRIWGIICLIRVEIGIVSSESEFGLCVYIGVV